MSVLAPVVIDSPNVSLAWSGALLHAYDNPQRTLAPAVVSISDFQSPLPDEDPDIRSAADIALAHCGKNSVRVSGMLIFPYDIWCRRGKPRCDKYNEFCIKQFLPRLKALDQRNRLGTYFERMMDYSGEKQGNSHTVDQLSFVINLLRNRRRRWPRRSALQIACFDPAKDHTGQPVRGFPCLQQVSISHDGDRRIALNAFYPTQYVFDRGYGNYLGLCHLGAFIAHETGLEFGRLNCFIGRPELGNISKSKLRDLVQIVRARAGRAAA